jgi:hypothetical protein
MGRQKTTFRVAAPSENCPFDREVNNPPAQYPGDLEYTNGAAKQRTAVFVQEPAQMARGEAFARLHRPHRR